VGSGIEGIGFWGPWGAVQEAWGEREGPQAGRGEKEGGREGGEKVSTCVWDDSFPHPLSSYGPGEDVQIGVLGADFRRKSSRAPRPCLPPPPSHSSLLPSHPSGDGERARLLLQPALCPGTGDPCGAEVHFLHWSRNPFQMFVLLHRDGEGEAKQSQPWGASGQSWALGLHSFHFAVSLWPRNDPQQC
jgi:hypothetical protein